MEQSCRQVRLRCSEYLDGDLPGRTSESFRRHLAACAPCAAFANTLRRTLDLSRQLPAAAVPARIRREMQAMVRAARASARPRQPRRRR